MKIRTQLVVAFLLLSVVPLTGIVLYSYASSQRAVRQAVEAEAAELTQEMNGRMSTIRAELGRSLERVGEIPLSTLLERQVEEELEAEMPEVLRAMGESAPFVDSLEFTPAAPPIDPVSGELPVPPAEAPPAPEPAPEGSAGFPAPPAPPAPPIVIDVREIMEEVRKAQQHARAQGAEIPEYVESATAIAAEEIADMNLTGVPGDEGKVVIVHPGAPDPEKLEEVERKMREAEARRREVEARLEQRRKETRLLLGKEIEAPVKDQGRVVGWVRARVRPDQVLSRVLGRARRERGEIPFAVDAEGKFHAASDEDLKKVQGLPIDLGNDSSSSQHILEGWVVVTSKDPDSGLTLGVARPIRQSLEEVKRTAARNFGWGLALIGLALVGILPLSNRMTRDVSVLKQGAEKIAGGDLGTRVSVRSRNEIGALAAAFNRMAGDLRENQERLVEQETEQRLLRREYERKTRELEEARAFQLSLLPKTLPDHPGFEIAVSMQTATEVGGDYYDFHLSEEGVLTATVGDATGHGARAGTMVTVVKSLFSADSGRSAPREFLTEAAGAVKRMELGRMAMGLTLVRVDGKTLTIAAAGMPPALLFRAAAGEVEEIALEGMPLGGLASDYQEASFAIAAGDMLLLMSDGLPELQDDRGEPFGYPRVRQRFQELGARSPEEVIAGLGESARSWTGGKPPNDDVTFVAVRVRTA
ncbi:MAG TPA: SpoIIE family protein phosphatase [Thermoanaerobaculia bacterium]|nr:SpoIIE family protein phosphatase [Thermoanaerobaculia bacterium]